ncbi:probable protein phosphatase 2C 57 [Phoenix dactylifera]|uniref:protein-serine/threonine phosphatase n=1 Tax=Phoenix dactylifera TaxID=42345 RepID=A0A8B7CQV3_PHODC|nr:probable protein phosphatase 2C 57 [Phoenix dactylifera]
MEGSMRGGENGSPGDGRPPNPLSGSYPRCLNAAHLGSSCKPTLLPHSSLVKTKIMDATSEPEISREDYEAEFIPILRSGGWADIGFRQSMEDAFVCRDNFMQDCGLKNFGEGPSAFYGVFDGHGGKQAADFACSNLPRFIVEDEDFPREIERVFASAFLQTDTAFAEACSVNSALASGTTALAALVVGRSLVVANAGDCRAVLCRRGEAIEMSRDHKPACTKERKRIEASGGYVYDGYLNGQLNVSRAIGDWHMEGMKERGGLGPLSAEPEVMRTKLTEEDEFLIMGCDGIWDVFRSQNAVDFARRKLQEHNDPATCCKELVDEALKRKSSDNLAVVVVCFQTRPPPALTAPRLRVRRSISAEGLRELQSFLDNLTN